MARDRNRPFSISIAPRSILLAIAIVIALLFIRRFLTPLALILVAALLAASLEPWIRYLMRWRLPRWLAVVGILIGFVGLLVLVAWFVVPELVYQAQTLATNLPQYEQALFGWYHRAEHTIGRYHLLPGASGKGPSTSNIASFIAGQVSGWLQEGFKAGLVAAQVAADTVLVVLLAIFFMFEAESLRDGIVSLFPASYRRTAATQAERTALALGAYVRGQLLSMAVLAVILAIGLSLVGVPYAWLLAVIAGAFEIIPWLGGFVGVIIATIVAITVSWKVMVLTWVVFAFAHVVQGDFLGPFIQSKVVRIPPAIVLIALVLGGELLGLLGAIVAVPVTAVLFVLVRNLYIPLMDRTTEHLLLPPEGQPSQQA